MTVVGLTRSLLEMGQVLGRIGRNGHAGRFHILYSRSYIRVAAVEGELGVKLLSDTQQWIEDRRSCRMVRLDEYLGSSNASGQCSRGGAAVCDVCQSAGFSLLARPHNAAPKVQRITPLSFAPSTSVSEQRNTPHKRSSVSLHLSYT